MHEHFIPSDKLSFVIANDYRLLQVMIRFGISLGFGEKSIADVCRECEVDCQTFLQVINYIKDGAENKTQHVEGIHLPSLMGYLKQTHAYFLEFLLPTIRRNLLNSIDCSVKNEVAFLFVKFYDAYVEEVSTHMNYEGSTVFAYVEQLLEGELPPKEQVHLLSKHHDSMEDKLSELKNMFLQYYPQTSNNHELTSVLVDLYRCEEEMQNHCLVEDNIFVPAVRKLEHTNRVNKPKRVSLIQDENDDKEAGLSDREREIVSFVARGFSNKEIADKLFLSVNTVTTHRRNIARKLNIHSPAGITIYAIVNKLVTLEEVNI